MADDDLPSGHIRFLDNYEPGLKDATYTITVQHTLSANANASVPDEVQEFIVSGPRFTLDPADIHAQFPPKGASSQFGEVLPHVVLNKRLLPWERDIPTLDDTVPWLALLVFGEDELKTASSTSADTVANYAQTTTVQQLLDTPAGSARVPTIDRKTITSDELAMTCQIITISADTFAAILPTARELPYLAHAREVDTSSKKLLDLQNAGLFSVVVANRFPPQGDATRGAKTIVHLVALEGFGDLLNGAAPKNPGVPVKLVSLCSWTFACLADPLQKFSGLAQNLAYDSTGTWRPLASLSLRLPFTPYKADGIAADVLQRIADGYVALGYHAATGEDGFAWYRGPFTPTVANPIKKDGPFQTASAAVIYDNRTGVLDHSIAAAWQCGRALALGDETFATTLMRLREKARDQLHLIAYYGTTARDAPQRAVHSQLAALFAGGALQAIQETSRKGHVTAAPNAARAAAVMQRPAPIAMLRAAAANVTTQAKLASAMAADADSAAVVDWLGKLLLLYGVPFAHLVPDAGMLPQELIRFFFLDPNWFAALVDGALSIGLGTSQQVALQAALTQQLELLGAAKALEYRAKQLDPDAKAPSPPTGPTSGLLVRSALVSGWPGLGVTGTANNISVPLLRIDHLAPDVLLCLFNGVPDTITLAEPHEGLEFGVDDNNEVITRIVAAPDVKKGDPVAVVLRGGGQRVLNINSDPNYPTAAKPEAPTDLLGALAKTLNVGTNKIGPADFAVQMVKGPEQITFSASPPVKLL